MTPHRSRRLKESQFDDAAFQFCLSENFSPNKENHNTLLVFKGYGLINKRNILRLKLANAKLRGSGKKVVDGLKEELKQTEKEFDNFISSNFWG